MTNAHSTASLSGCDAQREQQVDALNDQAQRCRRLAGATYNREVSQMLDKMAQDFERSAGELSTGRSA